MPDSAAEYLQTKNNSTNQLMALYLAYHPTKNDFLWFPAGQEAEAIVDGDIQNRVILGDLPNK